MDNTLLLSNLTPNNPYIVGSAPDNLIGYNTVAGTLNINSIDGGALRGNGGILYDTIVLSGITQIVKCTIGSSLPAWAGPVLIDSLGNGYYLEVTPTENTLKLFLLNTGTQGTQIGATIPWSYTSGASIMLQRDIETKNMRIYINDEQQGVTYNNATHTPLYAGIRSDGGVIRSLTSNIISAQNLIIESNLIPGVERTDNCTGFSDGVAEISFAGVVVEVIIESGTLTWTVPTMSGGIVWPRLPSTNTNITLSQGSFSASTTANINLPIGIQTLREGDELGDPENPVANFSGIVTNNNQFIGYHTTLTTNDTGYFNTANGYWISQNGAVQSNQFLENGVTLALPRTDLFLFQDQTGLLTEINITMNAAGGIIIIISPNPFTFGQLFSVPTSTLTTSLLTAELSGMSSGINVLANPSNGLQFRISSDAGTSYGSWLSSPSNVQNGYLLQARILSSPNYLTQVTGNLSIGGVVGSFSVTTELPPPPPTPDPVINNVDTVIIGNSALINVSNFNPEVSVGTLDGKPLAIANNKFITLAGLVDGVPTYRPGTRQLYLSNNLKSAVYNVDVFAPANWNYYLITGSFEQDINGASSSYLPSGWATGDYIFYTVIPSQNKVTTVTDNGIKTSSVGVQKMFLVKGTTGMTTAFSVNVTEDMLNMNYTDFKSRYYQNTRIPQYTNMVVCDIYQQFDNQIVIGACPLASNINGIGRFNVSVKAGSALSDKVEVYVTLAPQTLIESESALDVEESNSKVVWHFVGNQTSNSGIDEGFFEITAPWSFMKIKFVGNAGTGAVVTLALT